MRHYLRNAKPCVNWDHVSFADGQLSCLCDKCHQATQCHGTQCFSSIKIEGSRVLFERGCLMDSEKIRMQCSMSSSFHYTVVCCSQEMCNSNTTAHSLMLQLSTGGCHLSCSTLSQFVKCLSYIFTVSSSAPEGEPVRYRVETLVLFILGPVVILALLSLVSVLACRRFHRGRLQRLQEFDTEQGAVDGLITSNVGDSTLAVRVK